MESYDNIILRRVGYVLFLIVLAVHIFNIGGGNAEAAKNAARKTVTFGRFEQDADTGNGPEALEWIVLEEKNGKCLLLSRRGLDTAAYHDGSDSAVWEQCSLRAWLNDEFLKSAFTGEEQAAIQVTTVINNAGQNARYSTDGGADTEDRIFLLSYREVFGTYLISPEDRRCEPTEAAVAHGVFYAGSGEDAVPSCAWWLRSPADDSMNALLVDYDSREMFSNVHFRNTAFRPALWVCAEALSLE